MTTMGHALKHSLVPYDDYYGKVLHETRFGFSLKYFAALSVFLILFELLVTFVGFGKAYPFFQLDTGIRSVIEQIPHDVVINMSGDRLSTNTERPIIIFNPDITKPGTLLVIDQNANVQKIEEYQTRYLFTGSEFVWRNGSQIMTYEYGDSYFGSQTLTMPIGEIARNAVLYITALYLVAILFIPIMATFVRVAMLFVLSVVTYVLCIKIIPKLKVAKVFQISLHAVTAPLILQSFLTILGLSVPMSFWWFNGMTVVFLIAALYEAYVLSGRSK
ncbi:MAG: hypothetical protein UZ22_OP11002000353 [Microgenomates bacterium OLB23]|nr:MAG: hypothetical protein UZ22_OP11002000353 [Microgenomates bacterium OLB23]